MKIDPKHLRPFTVNEFRLGTHYLKEKDDTFSTVTISKEDLEFPGRKKDLKLLIEKYCLEGRLFVRVNSPFKSFEE